MIRIEREPEVEKICIQVPKILLGDPFNSDTRPCGLPCLQKPCYHGYLFPYDSIHIPVGLHIAEDFQIQVSRKQGGVPECRQPLCCHGFLPDSRSYKVPDTRSRPHSLCNNCTLPENDGIHHLHQQKGPGDTFHEYRFPPFLLPLPIRIRTEIGYFHCSSDTVRPSLFHILSPFR